MIEFIIVYHVQGSVCKSVFHADKISSEKRLFTLFVRPIANCRLEKIRLVIVIRDVIGHKVLRITGENLIAIAISMAFLLPLEQHPDGLMILQLLGNAKGG